MRSLIHGILRLGAVVLHFLEHTILPVGTNCLGILLFMGAFTPAIVMIELYPATERWILVVLGGVISLAIDAGLRKALGHESLLEFDRGPRMVFIPLWIWGLLWIVVGVVQKLWDLPP